MQKNGDEARAGTLELRLALDVARRCHPNVDRLSLALYAPESEQMTDCASSNADEAALGRIVSAPSAVPSLNELVQNGSKRLIEDLLACTPLPAPYGEWLRPGAYRASFAMPLFRGKELAALVLLDSKQPGAFTADDEATLTQLGQMAAQLFVLRQGLGHGDSQTVRTALRLSHTRQPAATQHLERRSRYCRVIAKAIAVQHGLNDEFIESLFEVGPMHDLGMQGISARILRKPGRLEAGELAQMKEHVRVGEYLVSQLEAHEDTHAQMTLQVLRNVIGGHHERGDGSGYPRGLVMTQIPIEARIVAVADVFEALTRHRPYKPALDSEAIHQELMHEVNRGRLDQDCVRALLNAGNEVADIQKSFPDHPAA